MKILIAFIVLTTALAKQDTLPLKHRVVCYYTNWSVYRPSNVKFSSENVDTTLCTHILYAFVGINDTGSEIIPFDSYQDINNGGFKSMTDLKTVNNDLKVLVSVGGWNEGSARFSSVVSSKQKRDKFSENVVKFLRKHNFDGIDLVWQYPASREGSRPEDKENFGLLLQELRESFEAESKETGKPRLLLSSVLPPYLEYIEKGFDIPKLNRYVDFVNLVAYDYHLDSGPVVNHHSPLYSLQGLDDPIASQLNADQSVKNLIAVGVTRNKINLGVPTYGRLYTLEDLNKTEPGSPSEGGGMGKTTTEPGYIPYYEICSNLKEGGWTVVHYNNTVMGPYSFKDNLWVGYDDEESMERKAQYAVMNGLGGVMVWTVDDDDFLGKCAKSKFPLLKAIQKGLKVVRLPNNPVPSSEMKTR